MEKRTKGHTKIYKTLSRKSKIENHEPHQNPGLKLDNAEE
jgi:hypothetical protein